MKLQLKSKTFIRKILFFDSVILILIILIATLSENIFFNSLDWKLLDFIYREFALGKRVPLSNRIKYVTITANTYHFFKNNLLDRGFLSKINLILGDLSPDAVIYDVIFAYSSLPEQDKIFSKSIAEAGNIYLPVAFRIVQNNHERQNIFKNNKILNEILLKDYSKKPQEYGRGNPPRAVWAFTQKEEFVKNEAGSGQINSISDKDGIFRHLPLFIRIDSLLFPTISLAVFLKYNEVKFSSLKIFWGKKVVIPATKENYLEKTIEIPIDNRGFFYIPYPAVWENSFKMIEAQNLLKQYNNPSYYDELVDFFEGNFVFIGDISPGISDLGNIPIEKNVPLISMHTAALNAFLTGSFFFNLQRINTILLILLGGILITISALLKKNSRFYLTSFTVLLIAVLLSVYKINHFVLIPISSILVGLLSIFFVTLITIQVTSAQHQNFVRNTFARYIPAKVVDIVIENPELLKLGGEEKEITILFSDIAGFTSISENMSPKILVKFINQYFTEMTNIILEHEGIVDKFLGDGIMSEFGVPLDLWNNAELAVDCALKMQKRLTYLNENWANENLPQISVRIGINTGKVIVGNMGSNDVFDYTAIGDSVNLASRLEGVNKFYGTKILISERTYRNINLNKYILRPVDFLRVKGRKGIVKVFEVLDFSGNKIPHSLENFLEIYTDGFKMFEKKELFEAKKLFTEALKIKDDLPSQILIERINKIMQNDLIIEEENLARTLTLK